MEDAGLVNVYVCERCGRRTVTKNRDAGTTPFMISCRKSLGCTGTARSSFYRVSQDLQPDLLFIKPTPAELDDFLKPYSMAIRGEIREHVHMGGLLDVPAAKEAS